jgi:sugar transferase (PEP-CTERM system associated)
MRIFNRYFSVYDFILMMGDVVVVALATMAVRAGIFLFEISSRPEWVFWSLQAVAVTIIVVLSFYYSDLYAIDQTLPVRELLLRLMGAIGFACIVIGMISYPIPQFGKTLYAGQMVLLIFGLCAWRIGFIWVLGAARIHARVLIVGVQSIGKLVAEQLCQQKTLGMEVVGFIGHSAGQIALAYGNPTKVTLPVFSSRSMSRLVEQRGVDRILLAGVESCDDSLVRELVALRTRGIPIEDCHTFYERLVSKIAIADLSPEWIVLSKGFRRDRIVLAAKRAIDVVASSLGLILSAPICFLTAIAIKLESPGPLLYRQERVGKDENNFLLFKFRSMAMNAEGSAGPIWASRNDPRVTGIGRFIRRLRIDEIPQMYNVLKGEMSFVGPRPERPFFVQTLNKRIPYYSLRHSIKPGITGWAQISYPYGDSEEDAVEKLQYDLYYIKNMSTLFDLQIIFETIKVTLLSRGAR